MKKIFLLVVLSISLSCQKNATKSPSLGEIYLALVDAKYNDVLIGDYTIISLRSLDGNKIFNNISFKKIKSDIPKFIKIKQKNQSITCQEVYYENIQHNHTDSFNPEAWCAPRKESFQKLLSLHETSTLPKIEAHYIESFKVRAYVVTLKVKDG